MFIGFQVSRLSELLFNFPVNLLLAANWGKLDVIKLLVEHGADINFELGEQDIMKSIFESFASEDKNLEVLKYVASHPALLQEVPNQNSELTELRKKTKDYLIAFLKWDGGNT